MFEKYSKEKSSKEFYFSIAFHYEMGNVFPQCSTGVPTAEVKSMYLYTLKYQKFFKAPCVIFPYYLWSQQLYVSQYFFLKESLLYILVCTITFGSKSTARYGN